MQRRVALAHHNQRKPKSSNEDSVQPKINNTIIYITNKIIYIYTLTKIRIVKAMAFPVVLCGCESWTIKKAESQRIDAFELWYWRRLLRSNQSIRKEISPEYLLEGLMLKLKLQSFGHLMQRTDSLEKTLMLGKLKAGKEGDNRG